MSLYIDNLRFALNPCLKILRVELLKPPTVFIMLHKYSTFLKSIEVCYVQ